MVTRVFLIALLQTLFADGDRRVANESTVFRDYLGDDVLDGYHPLDDGTIHAKNILRPRPAWGCKGYSAAIYTVTKDAIAIARRTVDYLEHGRRRRVAGNDSTMTTDTGQKERKLTIVRQGVGLCRDLIVILRAFLDDTTNAVSTLGQRLSNDFEWHVLQLPGDEKLISQH